MIRSDRDDRGSTSTGGPGAAADLFYAGPATDDRTVVESLITDVGFRPQYVGAGPDAHQAVDSLATLWFALAFGQHRDAGSRSDC